MHQMFSCLVYLSYFSVNSLHANNHGNLNLLVVAVFFLQFISITYQLFFGFIPTLAVDKGNTLPRWLGPMIQFLLILKEVWAQMAFVSLQYNKSVLLVLELVAQTGKKQLFKILSVLVK